MNSSWVIAAVSISLKMLSHSHSLLCLLSWWYLRKEILFVCFIMLNGMQWWSLMKLVVRFKGLICLYMTFHMECQMIWTWKTSITMTAFEWFSSSMLSIMSGEFITAGKSPFTSFPWTLVRFFSWNWQKYKIKKKSVKHLFHNTSKGF